MKKTVLRFGVASGLSLMTMSAVMLPMCLTGKIPFEKSELIGYASMVLAFLFVFFGIRSYRESTGGGFVTFGKAFQVGILITLITCAMYVVTWEILYFNFFPDFLVNYREHVMTQLQTSGASAEKIAEVTSQMEWMAKYYNNVFFNSGITFLEVFPVGLVMTLVSAGILRKRPAAAAPAAQTA